MVHCRFVGNDEAQVGEREFSRIGEIAMFSEAIYQDTVIGGGAFIPEEDFKKIGFSADELAAHGHAEGRDEAPASFNQKVDLAQQVFRDLRNIMLSAEVLKRRTLAEISDNAAPEPILT